MAADPKKLVAAARAAGDPVAGLRAVWKPRGDAEAAGATLRAAFPSLTPQDVGRAFGARKPKQLRAALTGAFGTVADRDMVATALASAGVMDPAALALATDEAMGQKAPATAVVLAVAGNIRSPGVEGLVAALSASKSATDGSSIIKAVTRAIPQVTTASVAEHVRSKIEGGTPGVPSTRLDVMNAIGAETLSHLGLTSLREPTSDAVALGKAMFSADMRDRGVPGALASGVDVAASEWATSMAKQGKDALSGIIGPTISSIADNGMSTALAKGAAGLMQDSSASGIVAVGQTLFATAASAIPVVGPLAGPLVAWGIGKLFGPNKERPQPPLHAEAKYQRRLGAGGENPLEQHLVTPSVVLAHLLRACMRWHRAHHPSPVVQFTDWRASPGPIDPTSDRWLDEKSKNWGRKGKSDYVRLGPWTPSAYGPAFRLVWSGVGSVGEVDASPRGGLRSTASAGLAVAWRDEFMPGRYVNRYRFMHDFLAEFTGAWNQGLSDAIARGIASAFVWGEDRPHLQRFRPYLQEIGWAEFICASALVGWHAENNLTRKMALEKVPSESLEEWASKGSWEYGMGGGGQYIDELYEKWGSDPTGSGFAALCFVTAEIRRCMVGELHMQSAAEKAHGQVGAIADEDVKARNAAFVSLTNRQPSVKMEEEVRASGAAREKVAQETTQMLNVLNQIQATQAKAAEAAKGGISMAKVAGIGLAVAAGGLLVGRAMRGGGR